MKHFEITLFIANSSFVFKCSTMYEALDAIRNIRTLDHARKLDIDAYFEIIYAMKHGSMIQHNNHILRIEYIDGEV